MRIDKSCIRKILVIKSEASGDVLLATPVAENLRFYFPEAEINFLTKKSCGDVLKGNPFINKAITYDISRGDTTGFIIKHLRKQNYDLVIDLFCNPRTALITFFSKARYRTGYSFRGRAYAYNIKVKPRSGDVHNIEFNLDSLRTLGYEIKFDKPKIFPDYVHSEFALSFIKRTFRKSKALAGINPCGTWETKVWSEDYFISLIRKLEKDFNILLFWGGAEERKIAERIKNHFGENVSLIPDVSLRIASAFIKHCDIFISCDTGPMHIAWTLGIKLVAIFGPTNSMLHGHKDERSLILRNENLNCLGCNLTSLAGCKNEHRCMKEVYPERVYDAVNKLSNS